VTLHTAAPRLLPQATAFDAWLGGIARGAALQVVGPTGSGKSTLLRALVRGFAKHGTRVFCYGALLRPHPDWASNVRWWQELPTRFDFKGPVELDEDDLVVIDDASLGHTPRTDGSQDLAAGARWMVKMANYVTQTHRATLVVSALGQERVTSKTPPSPLGKGFAFQTTYIVELVPLCQTTTGVVSTARLLKNRRGPVEDGRFWMRPHHAAPLIRT